MLGGTNSYSGGTAINGGTLQISSDANLGDIAGDVTFDGGTLHTTADIATDRNFALTGSGTFLTDTSTTYTVNGLLSGSGALTKDGGGSLVLTADSAAYAGTADIVGGTLVVNGTLGGMLDVTDGRLEGIGTVGLTTNHADGVIAPGNGGIGTLTIEGGYVGDGGTLEMDVKLGGDSSPHDLLVIDGATAGTSSVEVTNVGGTGAPTQDGIKIIDVSGGSNGTFQLDGDYLFDGHEALIAGAYAGFRG